MSDATDTVLARFLGALSKAELASLLMESFGDRVAVRHETTYPVTRSAFERLTPADVETIAGAACAMYGDGVRNELSRWREHNNPAYRRAILRYGCTVEPALLRDKTGMTNANPPPNVHSMMRSDVFAGDLYSGDMVASALHRAGLRFQDGCNYLDFGCSSAALLRNMAAAFPQARWHGCDPVRESIAWASQHFPQIALVKSEQDPPLPFAAEYFRGVYAVSIWSHFSERIALRWFDEIHRVVEPGGFLNFTTHGYRSLLYYLELGLQPQGLGAILCDLLTHQYAFRRCWDDPSQEYGLQVADWGMAYFTVEWVTRHLFQKFRLVDYQAGLNQSNQDVYVLTRI